MIQPQINCRRIRSTLSLGPFHVFPTVVGSDFGVNYDALCGKAEELCRTDGAASKLSGASSNCYAISLLEVGD